ncbi:MAG: M1 family metallopeptidase [FCB group bacterium]|nr:M1 family metallopeptidase [FCB group bacterium]
MLFIVSISMLVFRCSYPSNRKFLDLGGGVKVPKKAAKYPKVKLSDKLRGELTDFRTCYDVYFYDLSVEVIPGKNYLRGSNEISAHVVKDFSRLQVDLYKNMDILKVTYRSEELSFERRKNAVFIDFPATEAGQDIRFRIDYEGHPNVAKRPPWDGGFVWDKDADGAPWIGVACEGEGASLWWPNKDHPSEEPDSMKIHLTVPDSLFGVSNGRLLEITDSGADKKTFNWSVNNPINNYDVTVNIGRYVLISDTLVNASGIHDLDYYVLKYHRDVAAEHFKQAKDVLHVYESYFGEYPWWEDSYKLVESPFAGMEHQSSVAYGQEFTNTARGYYNTYDSVDYIILHETAHEWWGNSITACDGADVWLQESFATYAEVLYMEAKFGPVIATDYLNRRKWAIRNARPMVGPRNVNYWGFDDVYFKGAWILHTLRSVINDDDLFFSILKGFAVENAKSIVCTEDFVNYVNDKTGKDFLPFFQQYLMDRVPPTLVYEQTDSTFTYRWTNTIEGFDMPLDILINKHRIRIIPTPEEQVLPISAHAVVEIRDRYFYIGELKKSEADRLQ